MNSNKKPLKVVCISDTHRQHSALDLPEGDILVHAGDATGRGTIPEIAEFNHWLGSVKHKYKYIIVIAGNHDWLFQLDPSLAKSLMTNAIYLQDESIELEGRIIYGSPWTSEFMNWAFMLPKGQPLKEKWDLIPHNLDLLITHGPPFGILDTLRQAGMVEEDGRRVFKESVLHLGCEELYKAVLDKNPKNHVFGHIHDGYGQFRMGHTLFANVSSCTEAYKPVNPPTIIYI
jgi:Icc-related predicted phosphoesterase